MAESTNMSVPGASWTAPTYAYEAPSPGFVPPEPATPMWRYMDFPKFMSIVTTGALFFARTDLLGDPFEGSLTRKEAERRAAYEASLRAAGQPLTLHATVQPKVRAEVRNTIVSCWHLNEVESMAMWRLYLSGRDGVAVRTTYGRFVESFVPFDGTDKGLNDDATEREIRIRGGMVQYVDYEGDTPDDVPRILLKRKSFEHEREFRAVATDRSWGNSPRFGPDDEPLIRFGRGGDLIPVHLPQLLTAVYVSPESQPWFADVVRATVEQAGLDCPVQQSDLNRDPIF